MPVLSKKLILPFIVFAMLFFSAAAQEKKVCFSVDDLPVVAYAHTDSSEQKAIMEKLVASLTRNSIPAIGFVNETKLFAQGKLLRYQVNMLKHWSENGLDLGNHTFSHTDFNNVSAASYFSDILNGEIQTKKIRSADRRNFMWFRHPYLHTGNTKSKSDSLNFFLTEHGYRAAPVTIDNDDYLFALAYSRETNTEKRAHIGSDYIAYMERKLFYFERLSEFLFERKIPQILLIHASRLNADYAEELADMFRKHNYVFAPIETVTEDPAFQTPVTVFSKFGISWIERWILSSGKSRDILKDDPAVPDYIRKFAE